jgi:alpha-beta hydrolase superfamily lysophospholipase
VILVVVVRVLFVSGGRARVITLPGGASSHRLARALDEQDVSLAGAWLLRASRRLPRDEAYALVPAMRDAYAAMHRDVGSAPSPALDTLLARQSPAAFDAIVIEPRDVTRPRAAVIFLHGYAGSFTLECWLVADAAAAIDAVTICPATGFAGHWSDRDGERILEQTLDFARARKLDRIYLAGLSNGAAGAGALAPRYASSLKGLILISGAPSTRGAAGVPTLVVQGDRDSMFPAAIVHAYAARTSAHYVSLNGGHFVLMIRRDEARRAIADWLRTREANR